MSLGLKQQLLDPHPAPGGVGTIQIAGNLMNQMLRYHRALLKKFERSVRDLVEIAGNTDLNRIGALTEAENTGEIIIASAVSGYLTEAGRRYRRAYDTGRRLAQRRTGRPHLTESEVARNVGLQLARNQEFVTVSLFSALRTQFQRVLRDPDLDPAAAAAELARIGEGMEFRAGDMYSRRIWGLGHRGFADEMFGGGVLLRWVVTSTDPCVDCPPLERGSPYGTPLNPLPTVPGQGDTQCWLDPMKVRVLARQVSSPLHRAEGAPPGWVPIRDVNVGDWVLTHHTRWRRVTALPVDGKTYTGDVIKVTVELRDDRSHGYTSPITLPMTTFHPLLVWIEGGNRTAWTRAEHVKPGMDIVQVQKECAGCSRPMSIRGQDFNRKFCSIDCRTQHRLTENKKPAFLPSGFLRVTGVQRIERKGAPPLQMWDLSVENDESYVVNAGIVSHNCRTNCLCLLVEVPTGPPGGPAPARPDIPEPGPEPPPAVVLPEVPTRPRLPRVGMFWGPQQERMAKQAQDVMLARTGLNPKSVQRRQVNSSFQRSDFDIIQKFGVTGNTAGVASFAGDIVVARDIRDRLVRLLQADTVEQRVRMFERNPLEMTTAVHTWNHELIHMAALDRGPMAYRTALGRQLQEGLTEFWARETTEDVLRFMVGSSEVNASRQAGQLFATTGQAYTPWVSDIVDLLGAAGIRRGTKEFTDFMARLKFQTFADERGLEIAKAIGRRRGWSAETVRNFEHSMFLLNENIRDDDPIRFRKLGGLLFLEDFKLPGVLSGIPKQRGSRFEDLQDRVLGLLLTTTPDTVEEDRDQAEAIIRQARSDAERTILEGALEGFAMVLSLRGRVPGGPVREEDLPSEPPEMEGE